MLQSHGDDQHSRESLRDLAILRQVGCFDTFECAFVVDARFLEVVDDGLNFDFVLELAGFGHCMDYGFNVDFTHIELEFLKF